MQNNQEINQNINENLFVKGDFEKPYTIEMLLLLQSDPLNHLIYFEHAIKHFKENKLFVTDDVIEQWSKQTLCIGGYEQDIDFSENEYILEPHFLEFDQINRIMWSALIMDLSTWTRPFSRLFRQTVALLNYLEKPLYPNEFIRQIKYLFAISHARNPKNYNTIELIQNLNCIPAIYLIPLIQTICPTDLLANGYVITALLDKMDEKNKTFFIEEGIKNIKNSDVYHQVFRCLGIRYRSKFIDLLSTEQINYILTDLSVFKNLIKYCNGESQLRFFKKIGDECIKNLLNTYEKISEFFTRSDKNHYFFLIHLISRNIKIDWRLKDIQKILFFTPKEYQMACLKIMNPPLFKTCTKEDCYCVPKKISNISLYCEAILAVLHKNNHKDFIAFFHDNQENKNSLKLKNLINMLNIIQKTERYPLITTLPMDTLKKIFPTDEYIVHMIRFLNFREYKQFEKLFEKNNLNRMTKTPKRTDFNFRSSDEKKNESEDSEQKDNTPKF